MVLGSWVKIQQAILTLVPDMILIPYQCHRLQGIIVNALHRDIVYDVRIFFVFAVGLRIWYQDIIFVHVYLSRESRKRTSDGRVYKEQTWQSLVDATDMPNKTLMGMVHKT